MWCLWLAELWFSKPNHLLELLLIVGKESSKRLPSVSAFQAVSTIENSLNDRFKILRYIFITK